MTESAPIPAMKERILLECHDDGVREIVSHMLTAAGYACRKCAAPMGVFDIFNSGEEFDLLLCNLSESVEAGLIERMSEGFPDIPVVIMTGVRDTSVPSAAIRNGAYDWLLKPFERDQLLAVVHRALEYRRLKLENRVHRTNLEVLIDAHTDQLQKAMADLERSYGMTLEALGAALDLKDAAITGHSRRVAVFTIGLARAMGLSKDQIDVIARGAFLHDIGKIATPEAILRKPGALNPDEIVIMREHCHHGYQILNKIPFLKEAGEIVYSHHERYDGTGYPRGLKGEQIPLGARLVAVANTFDAILSYLPYRAAQSVDAAREEIHRWSGRQFDPVIVSAFLTMPDKIWEDLRRGINAQQAQLAKLAQS